MPVESVSILNSFKDDEGKEHLQKYYLEGRAFGWIVDHEMEWGEFYRYINSVGIREDITDEEPSEQPT